MIWHLFFGFFIALSVHAEDQVICSQDHEAGVQYASDPLPSGESAFDQDVLKMIFSLRDEGNLRKLKNNPKLNEVARRVAEANLNGDRIRHKDSEGKGLQVRMDEEGYQGRGGEIAAVVFFPCESESKDPTAGLNQAKELGAEFKKVIRESPPHYQGLMERTGVSWEDFGYSIRSKQVEYEGFCFHRYSLGLVFGKP
ncbi:MAG: hypothetical protein KGP28_05440 [Bdellovibrionales bacterium]|nr:hypothetical protein [Bdellovibrionales bacterium]